MNWVCLITFYSHLTAVNNVILCYAQFALNYFNDTLYLFSFWCNSNQTLGNRLGHGKKSFISVRLRRRVTFSKAKAKSYHKNQSSESHMDACVFPGKKKSKCNDHNTFVSHPRLVLFDVNQVFANTHLIDKLMSFLLSLPPKPPKSFWT